VSKSSSTELRTLILHEGEEYEIPAPLVAYLEHLAESIETVADQLKETQRALVTVAVTMRHRPGVTDA
jgi:hypothetical protein